MNLHYLIIFISLIFSAFFSGMEIAFISSNKLRIEVDKKQGKFSSKLISRFVKNPSKYIATMLLGNNIALVIYGLSMAIILESVLIQYITSGVWILIIQTFFSTIIILFTAEFIPKVLFKINPNLSLNLFSTPTMFFYIIFYPITIFTIYITNLFLKYILKANLSEQNEQLVFGKVDLSNFLNQVHKNQNENDAIKQEIKIIQNALDFNKVKLKECIIPRNEIAAIDYDSSIEELKEKINDTGFSKIIIYKKTIDNIIGYVHSLELFKSPKTIKSIMVKIPIVPQTMSAKKLFDILVIQKKSLSLVVDEYGGTAGIVSIEDILEEIFGEIEDEHDFTNLKEKQLSENKYIFSGRLEIDYINEKYKINIPISDDYETIAGFILKHHETIPDENDDIYIDNFHIKVLKVLKPRIDLVNIEIIK